AGSALRVIAAADGYASSEEFVPGDGVPVAADATSVTVPLVRRRRTVWPVEPGDVAAPPDGTVLVLRAQVGSGIGAPASTAVMERGQVVVEGVAPGRCAAVAFAPSGVQAYLWCGPSGPKPAKFVKTPRVDVV